MASGPFYNPYSVGKPKRRIDYAPGERPVIPLGQDMPWQMPGWTPRQRAAPVYAQGPEDIWAGFGLSPRQPLPSWAQTAPSLAPPAEWANPLTGQEKVIGGPDARYAYMQKGRNSLEWQNFVPWYTTRYGRAPVWGKDYANEWQDFLTGAAAPPWLQPQPTRGIATRPTTQTRSVSRWGVEYPGLGDVWAGLARNSAPAGLTAGTRRLY